MHKYQVTANFYRPETIHYEVFAVDEETAKRMVTEMEARENKKDWKITDVTQIPVLAWYDVLAYHDGVHFHVDRVKASDKDTAEKLFLNQHIGDPQSWDVHEVRLSEDQDEDGYDFEADSAAYR